MTTSPNKFFMKKVLDTCNFSLGDRWELELKKKKKIMKKKKKKKIQQVIVMIFLNQKKADDTIKLPLFLSNKSTFVDRINYC